MRNDIIYAELSYKLTGLLMKTQEKLGRYAKEKQYGDALEILLTQENIAYKREPSIPFNVAGEDVRGNRIDFIVEDKILIELKALPYITKRDYYQTSRYLRATNLKLGLLVNCHSQYLKPKRILNSSFQD
ncbi:MAG: hypothetical protein A3A97_04390 [Candidatus Terrybacteria bacterium RIFCSPLOWO2_01_FULL_40_23]|uniref:GxxExxY protein n=1 Tax=Candidatus Terrybacteria bacterium RIFCSPLOWO2_01_FULL_40_23 TaxID=1802366 RepID=A0A1G2PTG5_9BACT|nr:MAG: hypothetical protein A3A97_04390 [Candidatus Terrybacteria bacterium RIFCSPLOWO2_01_FULL_40_23]